MNGRLPNLLKRGLMKAVGVNVPGRLAERRGMATTLETPPGEGRFIADSFGNAAGTREFKLYVPSGYTGSPLPLVVMLHGCTQTPDDFAAGTRMNEIAEERTCFVVYPAQAASANAARCWNWFNATDQRRGSGEPYLIAGLTQALMLRYAVDPARVFVAGLSAGAAAAAVLGATYPDLFRGLGIHSGLPSGSARNVPSALMAMRNGGVTGSGHATARVRTIVFHGDRDSTVHPSNGAAIVAHAAGNLVAHRASGQVPHGHAYTRTTYTDAAGTVLLEYWDIAGAGHAWAGGSRAGSFTDPLGPDASREIMRFFLDP